VLQLVAAAALALAPCWVLALPLEVAVVAAVKLVQAAALLLVAAAAVADSACSTEGILCRIVPRQQLPHH
jgi:hypothetical protein